MKPENQEYLLWRILNPECIGQDSCDLIGAEILARMKHSQDLTYYGAESAENMDVSGLRGPGPKLIVRGMSLSERGENAYATARLAIWASVHWLDSGTEERDLIVDRCIEEFRLKGERK